MQPAPLACLPGPARRARAAAPHRPRLGMARQVWWPGVRDHEYYSSSGRDHCHGTTTVIDIRPGSVDSDLKARLCLSAPRANLNLNSLRGERRPHLFAMPVPYGNAGPLLAGRPGGRLAPQGPAFKFRRRRVASRCAAPARGTDHDPPSLAASWFSRPGLGSSDRATACSKENLPFQLEWKQWPLRV